jgi:hypothetical protein
VRIGLLALGGWLVAAVLTVGLSWSAIRVVGDAVVPSTKVAASLPTPDETVGPPTATPTRRPSPTATFARASFSGTGGTVIVECRGSRPVYLNVTPRDGYAVERNDPQVEFRSDTHRTELTASCAAGRPQAAVEERTESDDSGGRRGRGGRGGGDDD